MIKQLANFIVRRPSKRYTYTAPQVRYAPEPPPGFVRRSDPNFYFLARKY